ncbi:MAG TPA: hypothetical protein VIU93_09840 [Gallionellaceae bacterium]
MSRSMPMLLKLTLLHLIVALMSGYLIAISVLGIGFSDSGVAKSAYTFFVYVWQALNAPAGIYFYQSKTLDLALFGFLQLLTSFSWSYMFVKSVSRWKAYKRSKLTVQQPGHSVD